MVVSSYENSKFIIIIYVVVAVAAIWSDFVFGEQIETPLIVGYPKWLKSRYDIYVDYVRNNLSTEIEVSADGIKRLVESDIEYLPWLYAKKPETSPEYFRNAFNASNNSTTNSDTTTNDDDTCIYDENQIQLGLTPQDMQAVRDAGEVFEPFCSIKSTWDLDTSDTTDTSSSDYNPKSQDIRLWSNATVVYVMNTRHSRIIYHAMETIMYMTCVKFEYSYISNRNHYLFISDAMDREHCNTTLGLQYNNYDFVGVTYQNLHLHHNCASYPIVLHLLLHSLGLANEHERVDRNQFIRINKQNVKPQFQSKINRQYVKHMPKTPYQLDSIMHFDSSAWAIDNTKNTIVTNEGKQIDFPLLGSIYDFQRINYLYGCHKDAVQSSLTVLTKEVDYEDDY